MTLPETIYAHARALPADLQREALDFIEYLERRYGVAPPATRAPDTAAFIARLAGSLSDDFPDDIDDVGLGPDAARETLE
ncbi:MAG: DUF2281 domain-containing protein [Sterolibacteriaceae bacterium]|uniref:DUF2281 domain-containing protein n=1 Tax=Candidatus Methylophosphatis roskildensis TaxID=2899263 RepID=A0A9D7E7X1_9PROT|nr:DUF2281 domain-containing protein [Candidatus Methylophosphatis roskildensis]MBK7235592.1 DUF2281 domain-containing protein [Sterolibacteriaceae bacterium]